MNDVVLNVYSICFRTDKSLGLLVLDDSTPFPVFNMTKEVTHTRIFPTELRKNRHEDRFLPSYRS